MVEISWQPTPNDRNSAVFAYRVKIQRKDGTFVEHPECIGTDPIVTSAYKCSVSMKSLLQADFFLVEGDQVKSTVEAMNMIDYSILSIVAGEALVQIEPHRPTSALIRGSLTNESQIEIYFQSILQTGGSPIDTYSVEMDDGTGFKVVSISPLLISPTIIQDESVTSGMHLTFRYRAHNIHGWSEYSPSVIIVAATVPDKPTSSSTLAVLFNTKLTFKWIQPVNTGGSGVDIDSYRV